MNKEDKLMCEIEYSDLSDLKDCIFYAQQHIKDEILYYSRHGRDKILTDIDREEYKKQYDKLEELDERVMKILLGDDISG